MSFRHEVWAWLHYRVNRLAWGFAHPGGPEWGVALRIDHTRWLWRLNDYLASKWVGAWIVVRNEEQELLDRFDS